MVKRPLASLRFRPFAGLLIAAGIVASMLVVMLGVKYWTQSRHHYLELDCHASFYWPPYVSDADSDPKGEHNEALLLSIQLSPERARISYHYQVENQSMASVEYQGQVEGFDVGTMTYRLQFTPVKIHNNALGATDPAASTLVGEDKSTQMSPLATALPAVIQDEISRAVLARDSRRPIHTQLQIIEMDGERGYALIRFNKSGNLWVCDIW